MTESRVKCKKSSPCKMTLSQTAFCAVSILTLALTYLHYEEATSAMSRALEICLNTLIPSLFPFMVISELILRSGAGELIARAVGAPFLRIFGISRAGANAFLLGMICGFPIGTRAALSLYERGEIDGRELSHLLCFCNIQSPAFVIGSVGIGIFGSAKLGICLFLCDLLSSVALGLLFRLRFKRKAGGAPLSFLLPAASRPKRFCASLTESVRSGAEAMLSVCAFIVFFRGLGGIAELYLRELSLSPFAHTLALGFFELTGGIFSLSSLDRHVALLCAAASIGWSGLSVHFQFISICNERRVDLFAYFLSKLMRALLNAALISLALRFLEPAPLSAAQASLVFPSLPLPLSGVCLLIFACSLPYPSRRRASPFKGIRRAVSSHAEKAE